MTRVGQAAARATAASSLHSADERQTVEDVLAGVLGSTDVDPSILQLFMQCGIDTSSNFQDFKAGLQDCHESMRQKIFAHLEKSVPWFALGKLLTRLG